MSKAPRDRVDDVDLMHYFDGEADEQTAEAVAAALADDADARARLLAMERMGETICTHLELAADDVDPRLDAMWATLERRIQSNGITSAATDPAREPVVAARKPAERPAERDGGGIWAAVVEWFDAHQGHFVTGMVTAGAVAALVLLLRPPQEVIRERVVDRPVAISVPPEREAVPPEGAMVPPEREAMVPVSTPPRVERLEVTDGSSSVFTIPGEDADDVATTVIWLDLDDSEVEEPL